MERRSPSRGMSWDPVPSCRCTQRLHQQVSESSGVRNRQNSIQLIGCVVIGLGRLTHREVERVRLLNRTVWPHPGHSPKMRGHGCTRCARASDAWMAGWQTAGPHVPRERPSRRNRQDYLRMLAREASRRLVLVTGCPEALLTDDGAHRSKWCLPPPCCRPACSHS
jgi:hypothetical protein